MRRMRFLFSFKHLAILPFQKYESPFLLLHVARVRIPAAANSDIFHIFALFSMPELVCAARTMHTYYRATHRIFLEVFVHIRESVVHDAVVRLVGPTRKQTRNDEKKPGRKAGDKRYIIIIMLPYVRVHSYRGNVSLFEFANWALLYWVMKQWYGAWRSDAW